MQPQHSHRRKDHENFGWPALVEEGYKTKALGHYQELLCNNHVNPLIRLNHPFPLEGKKISRATLVFLPLAEPRKDQLDAAAPLPREGI